MGRLKRLDGLRGVLAVYVMLGHALPFTTLPGWCTAPFSHGEAAVDLFFALSGLVIINSLEHYHGRFLPFLNARAWRLLPVYFVVLALALALLGFGSPFSAMPWAAHSLAAQEIWPAAPPHPLVWNLAAHIAMLHGILPQGLLPFSYVTLLGPAWSLSTEWQFYLAIALVVPRISSRHRLAIFATSLLAVGVAYHALAPFIPPYWQFSRAFLPDAAPYFALGVASAVWLRGGGIRPLLFCLAVTCALGLGTAVPWKALVPFAWVLAVLIQKHKNFPVLGPMLDSRAAQYLGAISYPLYLLNEPVQRGLAMLIAPCIGGNASVFTVLWLPLAIGATLIAATILHHGIETPLMSHRSPARSAVNPVHITH